MGAWYWTYEKNVTDVTDKQLDAIWDAICIIKDGTPKPYFGRKFCEFRTLKFFVDNGMNYNNGVMGATYFFRPNIVYLSPTTAKALEWKSINGIPNNEIAMRTVIHELTHLQQMRVWYGLYYLILNAPWFSWFTLEKHAYENEEYVYRLLNKAYQNMKEHC